MNWLNPILSISKKEKSSGATDNLSNGKKCDKIMINSKLIIKKNVLFVNFSK